MLTQLILELGPRVMAPSRGTRAVDADCLYMISFQKLNHKTPLSFMLFFCLFNIIYLLEGWELEVLSRDWPWAFLIHLPSSACKAVCMNLGQTGCVKYAPLALQPLLEVWQQFNGCSVMALGLTSHLNPHHSPYCTKSTQTSSCLISVKSQVCG